MTHARRRLKLPTTQLLSEARLRCTLAEQGGSAPIHQFIDCRTPQTADQRLIDAVLRLDRKETRQLAVVDQESGWPIGMLPMSDLNRAHSPIAWSHAARCGAATSKSTTP